MGTEPADARGALALQEPPGRGRYVVFFLALTLGVLALGLLYSRHLEEDVGETAFHQMEAVAALRVRQLVNWREERLGDGNILAHNAAFGAMVRRSLAHPEDLRDLEALLKAYTSHYQYDAAFVFDDRARCRLALPREAGAGAEALAGPAAEVLRSDRVTLLDFYADPSDAAIHLAVLTPLRDPRASTRPAAVLALRMDPRKNLFPDLEKWPSESPSAETLLVRREGHEAVVLNELRAMPGTALRLRVSLEKTERLAVQAALGRTGQLEGIDFLGRPVLGVARPVPGSAWRLVAALEKAEVQGQWWAQAQGFWLSAGLVLALAGTGLALLWRGQQGWFYRRQAELGAELKATAEQLEGMLSSSPTMIYELRPRDGRLRFVTVSRNIERILGYTVEEVLQPSWWWQSLHPEDRRGAFEATRALRDRDLVENEYRLFRKDGSLVWIHDELHVMRREAGMPVEVTGASREITARKEAEAALHVKNLALESALDAIALADLEGTLTWVNSAFLDLWGYGSAMEVLGRPAKSFWESPERAGEIVEALRRQGSWAGELEALTAQGTALQILVAASLVLDPAGHPICMLASFSDITERLRAEAALRTSLHEKEALLLEVHHRVKNNLQVISSLLRLEARRSTLPEVKNVLGEMQSRVASMALLHEILYRSGNLAQVDLASYLTRLGNQVARSMAPGTVRLNLDVAPVRVELDQAVPCGLLVNELLSNALKHGFPEGRTGEVWLRLHPAGDGPQLRLEVLDTGVGLPDDFEARSANSLGLQLVRDLARQLHGALEILPGPGARFALVFIPRVPTPEGEPRS